MTIVCFGEVLIRLSPPGARLLAQAQTLDMYVGGAEANVAVSLSRLGSRTRMISILPRNELGNYGLTALRAQGVDVSGVLRGEGRMGLYVLNPAAALRAADVIYDRAASAFAIAQPDAVDWTKALAGAAGLHISGVSPALGEHAALATLRAAHAACAANVPVSFDGNYRGKLWSAWRTDGGAPILRELMGLATTAFINAKDIKLILGETFDSEQAAARAAFAAFPKLKRTASTARVRDETSRTVLSAFLHTPAGTNNAGPICLGEIIDRIGAGDAFAAGLLHALGEKQSDGDALKFALAAACLKHGVPGDFNLATEADVRALLSGEQMDVRR